jgi:hypothetical protein
LFEGSFEIFNDLPSQYVGIGEIVGFFEALVSEPEDVAAYFVAMNEFFVVVFAPATTIDT